MVVVAGPSITSVTDNKSPDVGTTDLTGGTVYINDPTPTLSVDLTGSGAVKGDTISIYNGAALIKTVKINANDINNGSLSINLPKLPDGSYDFTATIQDQSSNTVSTFGDDNTTVVVDTAKPVVDSISVNGDNLLTDSADANGFTVTGTASGGPSLVVGDTVTVSIYDKAGGSTPVATQTGTITGFDATQGVYDWSVSFGPSEIPLKLEELCRQGGGRKLGGCH